MKKNMNVNTKTMKTNNFAALFGGGCPGGFHGGEQQETLPGGGFHGGERQKRLPKVHVF
ncbi:MAG: hypothetical protein Q4C61_06585 [Lachnospiraceae bacterium]|nr:hypothetical protein [Lachnospiraceae bacterium]